MKTQTTSILAIVMALAIQTAGAADAPKARAATHQLSPGAEMADKMAKAKMSPEVIVTFVKNTTLPCDVTADDIIVLHQQGVPNKAVLALIEVSGARKRAAEVMAPASGIYPPTVANPRVTYTTAEPPVVAGPDYYYTDYGYPYYGYNPYGYYPGYVGVYGGGVWGRGGWAGGAGHWDGPVYGGGHGFGGAHSSSGSFGGGHGSGGYSGGHAGGHR